MDKYVPSLDAPVLVGDTDAPVLDDAAIHTYAAYKRRLLTAAASVLKLLTEHLAR